MASFRSLKSEVFDREERKLQYQSYIRGLNAYDRHKKFVNDYIDFYGKEKNVRSSVHIKTDRDTLREGYRFILSEDDDMDSSWEKRLVKRYYDKLFKEYCIADMSQYKKGKIGLRWRTEKEVISGKGQFVCGNRDCNEKDNLGSYEVNFSYNEAGESKQALVKLVACKRCAEKLVYRRLKEKEQEQAKAKERAKANDKIHLKRKREMDGHDNSTDDECDGKDARKKALLLFPIEEIIVSYRELAMSQDMELHLRRPGRQAMMRVLRSFLRGCFPEKDEFMILKRLAISCVLRVWWGSSKEGVDA